MTHHLTSSRTSPSRAPARPVRAIALAVLLAAGTWALATQDARAAQWQVSTGIGDRASIKKVGFGLVWDSHAPLWQGQLWQVRLLHEVQLGYWDVPRAKNILEVGYSPFFRLQRGTVSAGGWTPFIEASIGVRAISHTRLDSDITMSTAFHFSDTLGAGIQFGNQMQSTIGVRFQHLSNAGIKRPNPGINFTQLYYQQSF
ncbi:MAG: acyloxyacyl hydrolase [Comamonas sp.]